MGKEIPKSLRFVKSFLSDKDKELENWLEWYNVLKNPDRVNVGRFLRQSHQWIKDDSSPYNHSDFFVLSAIGSTARRKPDYNDVDLLMATNRIWRDMANIGYLEKRLGEDFSWKLDTDVDEAYQQPCGRPERTLLTLKPKSGPGKVVHVTVQPEVPSEEDLKALERERDYGDRVVLYRVGDINGRCDGHGGVQAGYPLQTIANFLKQK